MASPLLVYANSRIFIEGQSTPSVINGRISSSIGNRYVLKCFLKRQQGTSTDTGAKMVPITGSQQLPGGSGQKYLYRGYALQYAIVASGFAWQTAADADFTWVNVTDQYEWDLPGANCQFKFGNDKVSYGVIERSSGIFGGEGIDEIIYAQIGGVQIQLYGGEVMN
jgi:hypothetical protein